MQGRRPALGVRGTISPVVTSDYTASPGELVAGEMRMREPAAKRRSQGWRSIYSIDHESFVGQPLARGLALEL
jgi:hypothetical protein